MAFPQWQTPLVKTPLTDFSTLFGTVDIQFGGPPQCKKFEMKYFRCMEAYGLEKGFVECSPIYADLLECKFGEKQRGRMEKIREELDKQVKEGKRSYLPPPEPDAAYEDGWKQVKVKDEIVEIYVSMIAVGPEKDLFDEVKGCQVDYDQ